MAASLRIAFLTPEYAASGQADGGLANYLRKVARGLVERGHQPVVVTLASEARTWNDDGVEVHALERRSRFVPGLARVPVARRFDGVAAELADIRALTRRLWDAHATRKLDLIQGASYRAPAAFVVGNRRVPVVCRVSSHSPSVRAAYGAATRLEDRIWDRLEVRVARRADACFAPSELVASTFERITKRHVEVLRSPLELDAGGADSTAFERSRPAGDYLLFFGTLSPIKGVDLLARALPDVLDRNPGLTVLFVGRDDGGPDGSTMWSQIERSCGSRARYLTAMPRAQLQPFIANARGVLMPSRIDNYPNACLEAQTLGVPVVGTYGSTLDEMIVDGETGFLAQNGDMTDIARAIERLLALSSDELAAMRARILAAAAAMRSEDRIGQLVQLYERTIASFRGARE
jgi:glycogen synthase